MTCVTSFFRGLESDIVFLEQSIAQKHKNSFASNMFGCLVASFSRDRPTKTGRRLNRLDIHRSYVFLLNKIPLRFTWMCGNSGVIANAAAQLLVLGARSGRTYTGTGQKDPLALRTQGDSRSNGTFSGKVESQNTKARSWVSTRPTAPTGQHGL